VIKFGASFAATAHAFNAVRTDAAARSFLSTFRSDR
jgi:hypothetical protein